MLEDAPDAEGSTAPAVRPKTYASITEPLGASLAGLRVGMPQDRVQTNVVLVPQAKAFTVVRLLAIAILRLAHCQHRRMVW